MKKFDDNIPIYLQIRQEIETAIITGVLAPDDSVPSIRSLAQQYQLNPQTVSNALSDLLNEGFLYKRRGIGLFVQQDAPDTLKQKRAGEFRKGDLQATINRAYELGVPKQELLDAINEVYNDKPGIASILNTPEGSEE